MTEYKWTHYVTGADQLGLNVVDNVNAPYGTFLNGVAAGAGENERDGSIIKLQSIEVRGRIWTDTTCDQPWLSRLLIVYDMKPKPDGGGFIPNIQGTLLGNESINAQKPDNKDRFFILWDSMDPMSSYDTSGGNEAKDVNIVLNLEGLKSIYSGSTAGYSSISYGALYMYGASDLKGSGLSGKGGQFKFRWKLNYSD